MKTELNKIHNKGFNRKGNSHTHGEPLISATYNFAATPKKKDVKTEFANLHLTEKEIAIIRSLAKGHSYKLVAIDCNITINTVRQHIRNIYGKLHVHSAMEAVVLSLKQKII